MTGRWTPERSPLENLAGDSAVEVVEEADIAFALSVSREVNRIYGQYLGGELPVTQRLRTVLQMTNRTLLVLQGTLTRGTAVIRSEVASAQVEEMLAVLFGVSASDAGTPELPCPHRLPEEAVASPPATSMLPGRTSTPVPQPVTVRNVRQVASVLYRRQRLAVRLLLGLLGYCLLGLLVDVPVAILALFPAELMPLTAAFVSVALAVPVLLAMRRLKTGDPAGAT